MKHSTTEQPLLLRVRMAFMAQGTSLHSWCSQEGIDRSYAAKAVSGSASFPAALELRKRILATCGISEATKPATKNRKKRA